MIEETMAHKCSYFIIDNENNDILAMTLCSIITREDDYLNLF